MCWLQYNHYPVHRYSDTKNGGPYLKEWLRDAEVTRTRVPCHEPKDSLDPLYMHLRMLRLADYYQIPDLTKYCLEQIEEYTKKHVGLVWQIRAFREKYPTCAGTEELKQLTRRIFAENAQRFVKDERFEKLVKENPSFAWAVVCHMAKQVK